MQEQGYRSESQRLQGTVEMGYTIETKRRTEIETESMLPVCTEGEMKHREDQKEEQQSQAVIFETKE